MLTHAILPKRSQTHGSFTNVLTLSIPKQKGETPQPTWEILLESYKPQSGNCIRKVSFVCLFVFAIPLRSYGQYWVVKEHKETGILVHRSWECEPEKDCSEGIALKTWNVYIFCSVTSFIETHSEDYLCTATKKYAQVFIWISGCVDIFMNKECCSTPHTACLHLFTTYLVYNP